MRRDWDAIVIGLGGFGSAAAYWLSTRPGLRVLGLEQFDLDHDNGASKDHSRIIRLSYHRPDYVRLAKRAYATWAEVEAASGVRIVTKTGWYRPLSGRRHDAPVRVHRQPRCRERARSSASMPPRRCGAGRSGVSRPTPRSSSRRTTGIADPNRGNPAHRTLAEANGATLLANARVESLRDAGGEYVLTLADGTVLTAGRVVITADAWTNELLAGLGRRLPLTITREQVTYFACPDPTIFAPERFPVWIWMDEPSFYGFPTYGLPGPKVAEDVGGEEITLATRTFDVNAASHARVLAFLEDHLPGMVGPDLLTKTCIYTLTPDRDFVLDRLPDHPGVSLALGCGHGFKFASVVGRILAELAIDGATPSAGEIEGFRVDRPILLEERPVRHFRI